MTRRLPLLTLGLGLVVGVALGYFAGRQPAADLRLPPVVLVVKPQPVAPDPAPVEPVLFGRSGATS